jgi:hypothetical protein
MIDCNVREAKILSDIEILLDKYCLLEDLWFLKSPRPLRPQNLIDSQSVKSVNEIALIGLAAIYVRGSD